MTITATEENIEKGPEEINPFSPWMRRFYDEGLVKSTNMWYYSPKKLTIFCFVQPPAFFIMLLRLLVILLGVLAVTTLSSLGLLSSDTAGTTTTEGRGEGEVDVLLGVQTDDEGGHVDDLLADADVALTDQDTGVVDGLGETELVDASLETTLKEILDLEGKDVIELHAGLVEDTDTDETANEGIAFEETLGVLLVEGKKLTVG